MNPSPSGYLTRGVIPAGAGPEQRQQAALVRMAAPWTPLSDAVADGFNDPVAVGYDPASNTWPSPQDNLVNFPQSAAPNYLAVAYAPPGSASIPGLPGRPVAYAPVAVIDGSAPSGG